MHRRAPSSCWPFTQAQPFFPIQPVHQVLADLPALTGSTAPGSFGSHSALESERFVGDCIWRWLMKKHKKLNRKRTRLVRLPSLLRTELGEGNARCLVDGSRHRERPAIPMCLSGRQTLGARHLRQDGLARGQEDGRNYEHSTACTTRSPTLLCAISPLCRRRA